MLEARSNPHSQKGGAKSKAFLLREAEFLLAGAPVIICRRFLTRAMHDLSRDDLLNPCNHVFKASEAI